MKYLKKFSKFVESAMVASAPSRTSPAPGVAPSPTRPATKPDTSPGTRPTPFRKDKPSVEPAPKATAEEVAKKFIDLADANQIDLKKIIKK